MHISTAMASMPKLISTIADINAGARTNPIAFLRRSMTAQITNAGRNVDNPERQRDV